MPNYIQKQLLKYKWNPPKRPHFCPFNPAPINYGKKLNIIIPEPDSPPLTKDDETYIQQVVGSFLYYAWAIDMTILHALGEIALQQANLTEQTLLRIVQLLDYMATNPNAKIRFWALDMILNIHSD